MYILCVIFMFLARLCIKSNARISSNIGFFFQQNYLIRAAFTLGAPTKKKGLRVNTYGLGPLK